VDELNNPINTAEKSADIMERVILARVIQEERFKELDNIYYNAQMPSSMVKKVCQLNPEGRELLKLSMEKLQLSARAYDRILKVSRTIADLDGKNDISIQHLSEAIHYRSLDRDDWAG
jgi:magnesium chelatase family protein